MDQRGIMDILSGRRRGAGPSLLRGLLWAASGPYAAATSLRRGLYRGGVVPSRRAAAPVISVGNITAGGTGKTPMVAWIVACLREAGATPAVLMRGYKAADGASDEAELLKARTGCRVLADPDRVAAAGRAVRDGADVLVMDDGFQHLRLRRDLDIVLIDATNPFGFGHCLPRGLLREPPAALKAAHAIVITRSDAVEPAALDALQQRLGELAPAASLHRAVHRPDRLVDPDGQDSPLDALAGRKVFAFCGIGNPDSFFRTLGEVGIALAGKLAFDDHEPYGPAALETICNEAARCGAEALITTAKDHVKLDAAGLGLPLWRLEVTMDITAGRDELLDKLRQAAGREN